jgi:hypothetical protein
VSTGFAFATVLLRAPTVLPAALRKGDWWVAEALALTCVESFDDVVPICLGVSAAAARIVASLDGAVADVLLSSMPEFPAAGLLLIGGVEEVLAPTEVLLFIAVFGALVSVDCALAAPAAKAVARSRILGLKKDEFIEISYR